MRMKAETFEVADPNKAMGRFQSLLGKLVKVPKSKHSKARPKRKRKP